MSGIAQNMAAKMIKDHMDQLAPKDPYYEYAVDPRTGKQRKEKRQVPPGLSKRDEKILKKVRKRAHYLDKGMNLCGFRVGWTFWIGIIPGLGDIVDVLLNYGLVVKPARKCDIPDHLLSKMLLNNAVSAGLGFIPVLGDFGLAAWKANSRNALLLESYLALRGQEYMKQQQNGTGFTDAQVTQQFVPGAGMGAEAYIGTGTTPTPLTEAPGKAPRRT